MRVHRITRWLGILAALAVQVVVVGMPPVLAQPQVNNVEASEHSISVGGDVTDSVINNVYGMTDQKVVRLVETLSSSDPALRAEALDILRAQLPEDTQFRVEAIASFFQTLGREQVPPERLKDTFAQIASENLALRERLKTFEGDDPTIQVLREQAASALEIGDQAGALAALQHAEALIETEALEALLADRRRQQAQLIAEQAAVERGRLNLAETAALFDKAAETVALHDAGQAKSYVRSAAEAWYEHGRDKGDNAALQTAILRWQSVIEATPRTEAPHDWTSAMRYLGDALTILGGRESGTERLEQATEVYRAALEKLPRKEAPLDWAMVQVGLGLALEKWGMRETGTARLNQAVEVYRLALEELRRDRVPHLWAQAQTQLGNVLGIWGNRESGTARLEQAVNAYRLALMETTREQDPINWAITYGNLGDALANLGERESGTARLEQAVEAFTLALEELTRDRVPLQWASTMNSLGGALLVLGQREAGTARLKQAVDAYRAAFEERTRKRVPLEWARTQNNLAIALAVLGERDPDNAWSEQAVRAYRSALEVRTRKIVPLEWAATQFNLALTLEFIAQTSSNASSFLDAAESFRAVAEVFAAAGDRRMADALEGAARAEAAYKAATVSGGDAIE